MSVDRTPVPGQQASVQVPTAWYNILPRLPDRLPPDLPPPGARAGAVAIDIPPSLLRQELSPREAVPIPPEVLGQYRTYRPTPLRRARAFERRLGTRCRIYYKYEGGNLSGSHKLNTALAQAHYYHRAGVRRLTVGTGAGQWGSAIAAACAVFGLECQVYMVASSHRAKPYRRTMMELLGARVAASPSPRTAIGSRARDAGDVDGSLALALAEAAADAREHGGSFCTGSGETYSLLHQTVIGLEARDQLADLGEEPDVVVGALGAGSGFGGLALPFVGASLAGGRAVRCVSVEPAACPKLTRGRYAYDHTDASGVTPLQKMYTLGSSFVPPGIHAGGLRYHATAKLISALYHQDLVSALACTQRSVFASAVDFATDEGILPAPESAHAVHGAVLEARRADELGRPAVVLVGVSGHGLFDMAAYASYHDGTMVDAVAPEAGIAAALADLPAQPAPASRR